MAAALEAFVRNGHLVDVALIVLLLEVMVLGFLRRRRDGRLIWLRLLSSALPGLCLLMAVRDALTGAAWWWAVLWLGLSLPAHVIDMRLRPP